MCIKSVIKFFANLGQKRGMLKIPDVIYFEEKHSVKTN